MIKKKTKGKEKMSKMFQELSAGDKVAVQIEPSVAFSFPARMQGRTGTVLTSKGKAYIIEIYDYNERKQYIINPVHLKKLK